MLEAVKAGAVRHIFLVGGCDGAKPGRNYYTEFVEKTPADTLVLTLACGKFRFFDKDLGQIGRSSPALWTWDSATTPTPRCRWPLRWRTPSAAASTICPFRWRFRGMSRRPWPYLLTLLALGVRDIRLGPSLPAFVSPDILALLVEKWGISGPFPPRTRI